MVGKIGKWFAGARARSAFRRRERKRQNIRTPLRWATQAQLIEDDLNHHIDVEGPSVLSDNFIEQMSSARDRVASTAARYSYAVYAVTAYFLLAILSVDIEISAFGITLRRVPGLNELLLIISAVAGALSIWHRVRVLNLDAAIKGAIGIRHTGPLAYIYSAAFLPSNHVTIFTSVYSPHLVWSPWKRRIVMGVSIVAILFIFATLLASVGFRLYAAYWVWSVPSTENPLLRLGIFVAPIIDVTSAAYGLMYFLPLPHRDYFLDYQVGWLRERYPKASDELLDLLYGEGVRDKMAMEEAGHLPPDTPSKS